VVEHHLERQKGRFHQHRHEEPEDRERKIGRLFHAKDRGDQQAENDYDRNERRDRRKK
jgi:hypothetical protein